MIVGRRLQSRCCARLVHASHHAHYIAKAGPSVRTFALQSNPAVSFNPPCKLLEADTLEICSNAETSVGRLASLCTDAQEAAAAGPVALYNHFVSTGTLQMDCDQGMTVYKLAILYESMSRGGCCSTQRGFYIYGPVGCGKTMAMDIFAAAVRCGLPHLSMVRVHLNRFLEMVHSDLTRLEREDVDLECNAKATVCRFQRSKDHNAATVAKPFNLGRQDDRGMRRTGSAAAWVHMNRKGSRPTAIERLAQLLAKRFDVLCLDEISITNLQNCVVLGPLISALCGEGVVLVATSNKAPNDLYEGGLDRQLHLPPLAAAICDNCTVLHQRSKVDYRKLLKVAEDRRKVFKWHCGSEAESQSFTDVWWEDLSGTDCRVPVGVGYGRTLPVLISQCGGCARFAFKDLCTYPPVALGSADYEEMCSRFHTVLVSAVPRLRPDCQDAARRWTLFLDSCYENHVRLILSTLADDPEDMINLTQIEKFDNEGQSLKEASFAVSRCVSRMHEMQSDLYQEACNERLDQRSKPH